MPNSSWLSFCVVPFVYGNAALAAPCFLSSVSPSMDLSAFRSGQISAPALRACEGDANFQRLREFMRDTTVIGITGYNGEQRRDYFGGLRQTIDLLGGGFVRVETNSRLPVDLDAPGVCQQVQNVLGSSRRAVIIGHSKGGATALYLFKSCPQVMASSSLKAVVSVMGVIHGSSYADWSVSRNVAMETGARILEAFRREISDDFLLQLFMGDSVAGISLTTEASRARLRQLAGQRGLLQRKMFCVSSQADPGSYASASTKRIRGLAKSAGKIPGPNDGLVDLEKQHDPSLCRQRFTTTNVNHLALIEADSADPSLQSARRAYAAALLMHIANFAEGR